MDIVTRENQETDTIYVDPTGMTFFTPDGEGRVYYETLQQCIDDTGISRVVNVDRIED